MISGRRPKRPDAQYYRQSRKRTGASRGGEGLSPLGMGILGAILVAAVVWVIWFR